MDRPPILVERFNRKERFFVMRMALGTDSMLLGESFRRRLSDAFGVDVPPDAYFSIDYHLDWLGAAMECVLRNSDSDVVLNDDRLVRGNQEDVDLIVAFDHAARTHVILVEAKGATGWSNKQMDSKAARLKQIFGEDGRRVPGVLPHFAIASPSPSRGLKLTNLPSWMLNQGSVRFLPMPLPAGRLKVTRCDERRNQSSAGSHWFVEPAGGTEIVSAD